MRDAAIEVCRMLDTKNCAQRVFFKSDTTGSSVEMEMAPEEWSRPRVEFEWIAVASLLCGALSVGAVVAMRSWKKRSEIANLVAPEVTNSNQETGNVVDEKKADAADDNASTATPDSVDSGKMDDLRSNGSSSTEQQV